jgi:hypothetical protein
LAAAARSSSHSVRERPYAPEAGAWTSPGALSASATAAALSPPAARSQTSRAARMAGRVRETRVGGGLGAPWTPTTVRTVSRTPGCSGNSDATCVSGPTPSSRTSKAGTPPWSPGPAAAASSAAYAEAAASASEPWAAPAAGIAWTRRGSTGTAPSRASRACVTFRSGSPSGRNLSSPHHRSSRAQSTASRAGDSAIAASSALPLRPPVSTTEAEPRAAWASTILVISLAAAARAISSLSRWTTT